jgi:hypothetical protein
MSAVGFDLLSSEPFADARAVGAPGPYRLTRGVLHFAVDPASAASRCITDLDRAPRDGAGLVHFAADMQLLAPVERADANGGLLYVVANRGNASELPFSPRTAMPDPTAALRAHDGLLLQDGWSVLWSGCQWDVVRGGPPVGLAAPEAQPGTGEDGLDGHARVCFRAGEAASAHPLDETPSGLVPRALPPAFRTRRRRRGGPRPQLGLARRRLRDRPHLRAPLSHRPGARGRDRLARRARRRLLGAL